MTRLSVILSCFLLVPLAHGQGDALLRKQADEFFVQERFDEALPKYAQLVSLLPTDRELNYRLGACVVQTGEDKEKAIGFLRYAVEDPSIPAMSWLYLGKAYHLSYRFQEALEAYQHFRGVADKKTLAANPVDALENQCRNGLGLLGNIKDVQVHKKVEVEEREFFRYYDLSAIGGKIVVTPDELLTNLDRKSKERSLIYLPDEPGPIYFSSLGKDGRTGRDIYRTDLLSDGSFTPPIKLAGYINTPQDESFAFMHPDGKTFYFSSKGHNSMGGYDVFRCKYDRGLDVFGPPENMDFAVNTPDDDLFYLVDKEGREACFASARNSGFGKVHVYRVSTEQVPVTITVLKGTFSSAFDPDDRAARIVVEDGLTRERVAELRTDINGQYLVALPRTGRYRFLVEAGPSGRTHAGMVEIPRSEGPRAYRQEMSLVDQDGQEKLMIKNYFDEPLQEDVLALAMAEIRRRATLDVNARQEQQEIAATPDDVLTEAGFTGDINEQEALRIAAQQAKDDQELVARLEEQQGQAFTLALEATTEAERSATEAAGLIARAEAAEDGTEKNSLMMEAARERRRSRQAALRAKAAYATAADLGSEQLAARQKALASEKRSDALAEAVRKKDKTAQLTALRSVKEEMDKRSGEAATISMQERYRRAAAEQEAEAARAMRKASSLRTEEGELMDRVARLKRERESTSKNSRKEEMSAEIAKLEEQLGYLQEEVVKQKAQAMTMEKESGLAKAEAALMGHLANGTPVPATELNDQEAGHLKTRIASSVTRTESLALDERFELALMEELSGRPNTTFDWSSDARTALATAAPGSTELAMATPANGSQAAQGSGTRTQESGNATPPSTTGDNAGEANSGRTDAPQRTAEGAAQGATKNDLDVVSASGAVPVVSETENETADVLPESARDQRDGATAGAPDAGRTAERTDISGLSREDQRFLLQNERTELLQLRSATREESDRQRLDQRLSEVTRALETLDRQEKEQKDAITAIAQEALATPGDDRGPRTFERNTTDTELIALLDPAYAANKARIATIADARERASGMQGLELMLVDSIQAETTRQLAALERDASLAGTVLPRVDRLRQLKLVHMKEAEKQLLLSRGQELAAADRGSEVEAPATAFMTTSEGGRAATDRNIRIEEDPKLIYESRVVHASPKVDEAVALMDRDLAEMDRLTVIIDSMEQGIKEVFAGKEYDKMRKKIDRYIDDHLITRTELGMRTEYITRQERDHAEDSLKALDVQVTRMGLAPNEPLFIAANDRQRQAEEDFEAARAMRKQADRSEDIILRDSLFRTAYRTELQALRALDQAITINTYILTDQFTRGEALPYAQVEQRLFGPSEEELLAAAAGESTPVTAGKPEVPAQEGIVEDPDSEQPSAMSEERTQAASEGSAAEANEARPTGEQPAVAGEVTARDTGSAAGATGTAGATRIDPSDLAARMRQVQQRAQELEQRSILMGDEASALRDQASAAPRKQREELEALAVRRQFTSDSLYQAYTLMSDSARAIEGMMRDAEERRAMAKLLLEYYYLSAEEQEMVMNNPDMSRYFHARSKALQQSDEATDAENAAAANRQLSRDMLEQAAMILSTDGKGRPVTAEEQAMAASMNERGMQFAQRADSLERVAARARGAATANEAQAAAMLQAMDAERSSMIMALEMRTRRTEPLLAEARSLATEERTEAPATRRTEAAPATNVPAVTPNNAAPARTEPVPTPREAARTEPVVTPPAPVFDAFDFDMPEELGADIFAFAVPERKRTTAIPVDAGMPKGLVYKVQIGAFAKPVPKELFSDMDPVMGETASGGLVRYTAGLFKAFGNADAAKEAVRDRGYRDAFVVAYLDGKRIPLSQARALANAGTADVAATRPAPASTTAPATIARPSEVRTTAPVPTTTTSTTATSAQEVLNEFAATPRRTDYYNGVPDAAPAKQVETLKGLFFTVQVGVYSNPVPLGKLFNLTPLNTELTANDKIRYTTGIHRSLDDARPRKDRAVASGVTDAFITAYLNGRRIPISEARELLARFGADILVDPSEVTP